MGHIKEPKGVDFVIKGRPLTKEEELAISKFIKEFKSKQRKASSTKQRSVRKTIRKVLA